MLTLTQTLPFYDFCNQKDSKAGLLQQIHKIPATEEKVCYIMHDDTILITW